MLLGRAIALAGLIVALVCCRSALQGQSENAHWQWIEGAASPAYCAVRFNDDYDIRIERSRGRDGVSPLRLTFDSGDGRSYSIDGHEFTVFVGSGPRLFWVRYNGARAGGTLVAVDLETGVVAWERDLRALGEVAHSSYTNRIQMQMQGDTVVVYGLESLGRYLEVREAKSGNMILHKVLAKDPERQGE